METYKVLFVGSPGSGKTTAIRSLSEVEVVDTDASVSDSTIKRKRTTTVGMDYGKLTLSDEKVLHLYGTPGQERFKFMWDLMVTDLAKDATALILLVDNTRNYPFKDIDYYLEEFWDYIVQRKFIIAVTRSDLDPTPTEPEYLNKLKEKGILAPMIFIDARKSMHVLDLIMDAVSSDTHDVNWSEVSHRVAMNEFKKRNPDPNSAQFEWLQKTSDVPKISVIEAAMHTHGVLGASHYHNNGELHASSLADPKHNALFESLLKLGNAIDQQAPDGANVTNISLYGAGEDTSSVFMADDQAFGFLTNSNISHAKIRQQADDLLQWSDHVESTEED